MTDSNTHDLSHCPRCHRDRVQYLKSMVQHSHLDWFKCDGCDHLFTRERSTGDRSGARAFHDDAPLPNAS